MNIQTLLNIFFILLKYTDDTENIIKFHDDQIVFLIHPEKISNRDHNRLASFGIKIGPNSLSYKNYSYETI